MPNEVETDIVARMLGLVAVVVVAVDLMYSALLTRSIVDIRETQATIRERQSINTETIADLHRNVDQIERRAKRPQPQTP